MLREQLRFLSQTLRHLDFIHMHPENALAKAELPERTTLRVLAKPGKEYLVYLRTALGRTKDDPEPKTSCAAGEISLALVLPPGAFKAQWLNPGICCPLESIRFSETSGLHHFSVPAFKDDIAMVVRAN